MRASALVRTLQLTLLTAATIAIADPSFATDCCSLNGGPCNIIANPGLVHGTSPWTGAVCPTTISGVNCRARLDTTDGSASAGDCITLGSGVTLDLNGRTITCTDDDCGAAVTNASSGSTSSKVIVKNGSIDGCWERGVIFSGGTDSSVTDLDIDLARSGGGSCNNGLSAGVFTPRGTTSRTVVSDAFSCYYLQPGEDLVDSMGIACYVGIANIGVSATSVAITNVQLLDNGFGLKNNNPGTYMPDAMNLTIEGDVGGCHCLDASNNCVSDLNDCVTFSSTAGRASFVDRTILP